jgi:hypothetical protein
MADTLSAGRNKSENEIRNILEKYIVGSSNNSDDASFAAMYFKGTKGPDSKSLPTSADAFPRSSESFRDLQNMMVPEVKKARKIMIEAAANAPVGGIKEDETRPRKGGENETAAEEKSYKQVEVRPVIKKSSIILTIIAIIETILIVLLLIKIHGA